jgi:hypothetical protein
VSNQAGWERDALGIGMTKIHHGKIPVTDLARSAAWYARR